MRRRLALLSLPLFLAIGCSSNPKQPAGYVRPEVLMRGPGPIFFGSGTQAPVTVDVQIANSGSLPITVRRVRIESPGMSQYSLAPATREYRETIASGQMALLSMSATAYASRARLDPTEPLLIRAVVELESGGVWIREVYTIRAER